MHPHTTHAFESTNVCDSTVVHSSPPRRKCAPSVDLHARDHLEKLIRKHGPPTPVSSNSSLRKLTSTSPIPVHFLPSFVDSPPASPAAVTTTTAVASVAANTAVSASYISPSGSRPIPIPRAVSSHRYVDDCPITPLTGRFEQGLFISQADRSRHRSDANSKSADPKRKSKKKSRTMNNGPETASSHHCTTRRVKLDPRNYALGSPMATMSTRTGHQHSPQHSPKPTPFQLNNLPRFHPAVYESPNTTPKEALPSAALSSRSHGYRQSSGSSRDALREYRELIAGVAPLRNVASGAGSKPSKPRLDPLGSPGPVTPLALEEAESYLSVRSNESDERAGYTNTAASMVHHRSDRLSVKEKDRYRSERHHESRRRS